MLACIWLKAEQPGAGWGRSGGATPREDERSSGDAEAIILVDALGAALATYQLYPAPENQPVYQRAVETLSMVDHLPFTFDIGPGVFLVAGSPVPSEREGADRLAKLLFVHDIGSLRIVAPVSASDMTHLFEIVNVDAFECLEAEGGFNVGKVPNTELDVVEWGDVSAHRIFRSAVSIR